MDHEFADFHDQSHDAHCQAWEACAHYYYRDHHDHDHDDGRHLSFLLDGAIDNVQDSMQQAPLRPEGESRGYADDATWILTSSFVIFTMQSGFGLLEAGSCSPGFEVNIMMKNIVDVVFSALTYYLVGYGISFGSPSTPFMGMGDMPADGGNDEVTSGLLYSKYIFQLSFAATATTIVSGCVAMRLKFFVYVLYSTVSVVFYSFVAHWVFAPDGWLKVMGVHDFAGGAPVHVFGGINGLVATLFLGPRRGRFDGSRPLSDFFPSSPTSQCFGLLALWWGWIGFNCGSSFGITDNLWVVAIRCAVTTINSTVAGGITSLLYTLWRTKGRLVIPDHLINGILGSLVAITPACAGTNTWAAFPIGSVGALVGLGINTLVCRWHIDDPVGAIGVHAGSGMWGLLSVGLFADSQLPGLDLKYDGLFRGGGWELLGLQSLAIVCAVGWALMWSTFFFWSVGAVLARDIRNPRKGLRVPKEEEERGADWFLHGVPDHQAYHGEKPNSSGTGMLDDESPDEFDENEPKLGMKLGRSDMYMRSASLYVGTFGDKETEPVVDEESGNGGDEESGNRGGKDDNDNVGTAEAHSDPSDESTDPEQGDASAPTPSAWSRGEGEPVSRRGSFEQVPSTGVLGRSNISHYNARDGVVSRDEMMRRGSMHKSAVRQLEIYR
ncbi:hypothetical protein ACHAWF_014687 [Thalassiosira exigua]